MKTAVSLPDELFRRAEELATRLGLSRSQIFARALQEFVDAHDDDDDPVTARWNELAELAEPADGATAARRLIDSGQWQW